MSVSNRHTIYDVRLGKASPVSLPGITESSAEMGADVRTDPTSGSIYPEHAAINGIQPAANFSSFAIADCLTEIGTTGLAIADLPSGLIMYGYKLKDGGGRETGTNHRSYTATKGLIVPASLQADHQGDATLTYNVIPTWDQTNDPFVEADGVAVPTLVTDNDRYAIGPVSLGGVTFDHIKRLQVDFGIEATPDGGDSDIYNTHVSIMMQKSTITLGGINVEWLKSTNIPRHGRALAHADSSFYLRKRTIDADGFVANATTSHVKGTVAGIAVIDGIFQSAQDGGNECSLQISATWDGTNVPIVLSPNVAIT